MAALFAERGKNIPHSIARDALLASFPAFRGERNEVEVE
jgi:hypothetical protein